MSSQEELIRGAVVADVQTVFGRAVDMVVQKGIQPPTEVDKELAWPDDLSELTSSALGQHLSHWSAVMSYVDFYRTAVVGAAREVEVEYETAYSVQYMLQDSGHVTTRRHNVEALRPIRNLRYRLAQLKTDAEVWNSVFRMYERRYFAISREVTRRGQGGA